MKYKFDSGYWAYMTIESHYMQSYDGLLQNFAWIFHKGHHNFADNEAQAQNLNQT
jgi:hypothetical protein